MTQWKQTCRWVLIAACAAQFSGCAQTSQWVSRWSGRDKADEQVAELDGRDDVRKSEKSRNKVKIASDSDEAKKRKSKKETLPKDDSVAAKPKAKKSKEDLAAKSTRKTGAPQDPFLDDADDQPVPRRSRSVAKEDVASTDDVPKKNTKPVATDEDETASTVKVAGRKTSRPAAAESTEADVREVSHVERKDALEPEWARETSVEDESSQDSDEVSDRREIPETAESSEPEDFVAQRLAKLKPSQASHLQLCPDAQGEVRELVRGLDDENLDLTRRSIHRLGRLGADAAAAMPALRQLLVHEDGAVRIHAALAICRIDGFSPAVLGALTKELQSEDPGQRSFAAAVIAELGPQSVEALPALAKALKDGDPYVRLHVSEVLIRHEEWSENALLTLLSCLDEKDENVRWLATYSLAELAPQSEEAVDALAEMLDDESAKVRIGAVYALGEIGKLAKPIALDLRRLDHDPNPELRSAVAYALEQIEAPSDAPAP